MHVEAVFPSPQGSQFISIALKHEMKAMNVPTISLFYGIMILMYWEDHAPPHFHVKYAEYRAVIDIETLELTEGYLPRRAMALVLEWAQEHRAELLEDWELCTHNLVPKKIAPLP